MEGVITVTEVTVVIEIFMVEVEVITRTLTNKGMTRSTSPIRTIQVVVIEEIIGVVVLTTITTIDRIQQIYAGSGLPTAVTVKRISRKATSLPTVTLSDF